MRPCLAYLRGLPRNKVTLDLCLRLLVVTLVQLTSVTVNPLGLSLVTLLLVLGLLEVLIRGRCHHVLLGLKLLASQLEFSQTRPLLWPLGPTDAWHRNLSSLVAPLELLALTSLKLLQDIHLIKLLVVHPLVAYLLLVQ